MRRMKTAKEFRPAPRPMSCMKRLGVLLVAEAGRFLLLHPLVSATLTGFAAEFTAGLLVLALISPSEKAVSEILLLHETGFCGCGSR